MLKNYFYSLLFCPFLAMAQLSPAVDNLFESLNADVALAQNNDASYLVSIDNKFRSLSSIATDAELFHVALHGTSALKECAIGDLVERKSPLLTTLFAEYLQSDEQYPVLQTAKLIQTTPAIQLFKRISWQKEKRLRKEYYERTTSSTDLVELKVLFGRDFSTNWSIREADSILTSFVASALEINEVSSENLSEILKLNDYKSNNYQRVKFWAQKHRTPEVLASLARYKNPADVAFFASNIDNSLAAISNFPHPTLFAKLRAKTLTMYNKPEFQDAVASYKSLEAKALLEQIHHQIKSNYPPGDARDEQLLTLYNIVEKKDCKIYQSVLDRLMY